MLNGLPRNWLGEPGIQASAKLSALQHFVWSVCASGCAVISGVGLLPADHSSRTQELAAESRQRHTLRMYSAVSSVIPVKSLVCSKSSVRLKNSCSGNTKLDEDIPGGSSSESVPMSDEVDHGALIGRPTGPSVVSSRSAAPRRTGLQLWCCSMVTSKFPEGRSAPVVLSAGLLSAAFAAGARRTHLLVLQP